MRIPLAIKWIKDEAAIAVAEFALIFPILFTLLISVWEVGSAIWVNQKTIAASQIVADLITRNMTVTQDQVNQAITAGRMAVQPFNTESYGVYILSVAFDEDDNPIEVWSEVSNMSADIGLIGKTQGLGNEGEGVVAVMVKYLYQPVLGGLVIGDINMEEVSFARGRRSAVVEFDGS